MENEVKYTKLRTTARLNYRTACEVSGETLAGVLEKGVVVSAVSDLHHFEHGHFWRKIKVGRKEYFAMADFLEEVSAGEK